MRLPNADWLAMTTEDFRDPSVPLWIAVLPVAAVEQHGPHLPLGVDGIIGEGYLARVKASLPPDLKVTFLPTQWVGSSEEHADFPGTLSLSPETALRVWTDIGRSVARAGVSKLLIINSHGGNSALVEIVARSLRTQAGMLVATASWRRLGYPAETFTKAELTHGVHAGAVETSLMQALRPDLVRPEKIEDFRPISYDMEAAYAHLRACGPVGFGWMARDLHPSGAAGDASAATLEAGEALLRHGAEAFIALLRDLDRFVLPNRRESGGSDRGASPQEAVVPPSA